MIRYHAKATSAVRFPSKGEAHCNSRRVLSLHRGVNFGLQRYTKSAIYFATQMQGKLYVRLLSFSVLSRFFWDWQVTTSSREAVQWLPEGSAKGPLT